ncbi:MAG: ComF family protein [Myxococcales bacterium]|nr:ComF family protein [Myxococcales bacterium]
MRAQLVSLLSALADLVAPARCLGCAAPHPPDQRWCGACALSLAPPSKPPAEVFALYEHLGPVARAIRRAKYDNAPELAHALGRALGAAMPPFAPGPVCLVPVPLHPQRLRERGYNQAAEIARGVAEMHNLTVRHDLLLRVRATRPQAQADRALRQRNLEGAFAAAGSLPRGLLLVVDDVTTTGSTLRLCREALRAAGAERVASAAVSSSTRRSAC